MRGKRSGQKPPLHSGGITPADAGKTQEAVEVLDIYRDHPRGCGENLIPIRFAICDLGSPPRMRGKLDGGWITDSQARITPADAGKTPLVSSEDTIVGDHPRGCGENTKKIL